MNKTSIALVLSAFLISAAPVLAQQQQRMSFESQPTCGETAVLNYDRQNQAGDIHLEYKLDNGEFKAITIPDGEDSIEIDIPDNTRTITVKDNSFGSLSLIEQVFLAPSAMIAPWSRPGEAVALRL